MQTVLAIAFIRAFFYQHIFFCSETIPPCFIFACQIASVNSTFTQLGDWNSRGRRSEKVITSRIPFCLSSVGTIASPSGERRIGYQLFVNFWRDLRPPTLAFRYWEIRKLTGRSYPCRVYCRSRRQTLVTLSDELHRALVPTQRG